MCIKYKLYFICKFSKLKVIILFTITNVFRLISVICCQYIPTHLFYT